MDDAPQRTIQQNRALHKYFELLAEKLNEAGLDLRAVLKPEIDIPFTKELVKDHLWRPVQELYMKKERTTELTTDEISKVYEVLNRFLGEKHGIYIAFPSVEEMALINELEKSL